METEHLKSNIAYQRREVEKEFKEEKIIGRENTNYAKNFLKYPNILAILGVRRSGKSTFSLLLSKQFKENVCYINFDDERLISITTEDLDKILQAFYELYGEAELIILDEIQNINGWELFANRLRRTKKVIITGSNSQLLSGELATHLTGRHIDFILYPFSLKEIINFKPNAYLTEDRAKIRKQLNEYVNSSGFPEFGKFGSNIVVKIYEDILNKDCLKRHKIKNEKTFKELSNYLISNFSSEFTYSKLSSIFRVKDVHTIKNYVDYLKEAFLIIVLDRFSPKLKEQVIAPKKAYVIDHGFCNFISFKLSKDIGKIFENIVCIELLRKKALNNNIEIYYWKDHQQNEIDFIVKEGQKVKQAIQVCYDITDIKTKEREIKSLLKGSNELKCNNLAIITEDREGEEKIEGKNIKLIPLWKWLLIG
ncbi:ATP-binding protein [Candidatus Woesearchaeota archaeon]|nr:ATP-binding protein [Candidatus Woesearchaeota archaeon]